jgi:Cu-processing system permease protein
MIRNRWIFIYTFFFAITTLALLFLSNDLIKVVISMSNIILILTPLVGIMFGTMYSYDSREFIDLLLAQPLSRRSVFTGVYVGLAVSLSLSVLCGMGIPMLFFGILTSPALLSFLTLCGMAIVLSIIFSLLAFYVALRFENRVKGFGISIFIWLFFAIVYDGVFLLLLMIYKDYPLENLSIGMTIFNPIDLARILILLQLDVSAMMGYTGAVLQKFLGSGMGAVVIIISLLLWIAIPFYALLRLVKRKDF